MPARTHSGPNGGSIAPSLRESPQPTWMHSHTWRTRRYCIRRLDQPGAGVGQIHLHQPAPRLCRSRPRLVCAAHHGTQGEGPGTMTSYYLLNLIPSATSPPTQWLQMKNPLVSNSQLQSRLQDTAVLKLSQIRYYRGKPGDSAVFGFFRSSSTFTLPIGAPDLPLVFASCAPSSDPVWC